MKISITGGTICATKAEYWDNFFSIIDTIAKETNQEINIVLSGSWIQNFNYSNKLHKRVFTRLGKCCGFEVVK